MQEDSLLVSLGSQKVERVVQFRVKRGADLLQAITEAVKKENIKAGVFISGLGALDQAVFRNVKVWPESFPVEPKDRIYLKITSPLELVSLTGWVAAKEDGRLEIHGHFSASTVVGETVHTYGGHLTEGAVAGIKVVVAIAVLEQKGMRAVRDESTGDMDVLF